MAQKTAVSAGAIILREIDGELKIALAQRQKGSKAWVLPKGHVEQGETLEQAALREIREEAGLHKVQLIKHLGIVVRKPVKNNGDRKTIHYFLAYALGSERPQMPTDDSFTDMGWFHPHEVVSLLSNEDDREFLHTHLVPLLKTQSTHTMIRL